MVRANCSNARNVSWYILCGFQHTHIYPGPFCKTLLGEVGILIKDYYYQSFVYVYLGQLIGKKSTFLNLVSNSPFLSFKGFGLEKTATFHCLRGDCVKGSDGCHFYFTGFGVHWGHSHTSLLSAFTKYTSGLVTDPVMSILTKDSFPANKTKYPSSGSSPSVVGRLALWRTFIVGRFPLVSIISKRVGPSANEDVMIVSAMWHQNIRDVTTRWQHFSCGFYLGCILLELFQNENARNENNGLLGILSSKRMSNPKTVSFVGRVGLETN